MAAQLQTLVEQFLLSKKTQQMVNLEPESDDIEFFNIIVGLSRYA